MGGWLTRIWDRRRFQPELIHSAWTKCIAKNRQSIFNKVLLKLCLMDSDMAIILRTSAGHAASTDEADFVMKQLADRIACFLETVIAEGVLNNHHEFNQACIQLGQQHAGFSRNEFQMSWWDMFADALMAEFNSASPEEQKAWRNLLDQVTCQMKIGYQRARSNMRRHS